MSDDPDLSALLNYWRRRRGLTQYAIADRIAVSKRHYQRIEAGESAGSIALLARIADVLALTPDEADVLYGASGHQPPTRTAPSSPDIPDDLLWALDREQHGAYLRGNAFDILAMNRRARANWPWMMVGGNIADLLLTGEGRAFCVDWETSWAPVLLAQLRFEMLHDPTNDALGAVTRRVCEEPTVRRIWRAIPDVHPRAYGTTRAMIMPPWGDQPVEMVTTAFVPPTRPDLHMIISVPAPHITPQLPRLPDDPDL